MSLTYTAYDVLRNLRAVSSMFFVAVLPAEQAATAVEVCEEMNLPAWRMGEIVATDRLDAAEAEIVSGAKGVDAGACQIVGDYA